MKLIKLSTSSSEEMWVNPNYIASFAKYSAGSKVFIANDPSPVLVLEKPEEIIKKIKSTYE